MALQGEEIRRRLREFAAAWGGYTGTERSEAQTFLNGYTSTSVFETFPWGRAEDVRPSPS